RRHHLWAGSRVEGHHLDRRVVYLGQRRHRELHIGHRASQQDGRHQQGRRDRAQDKGAGRIHWLPFVLPAPAMRAATFIPRCNLSTPSMTTTSPGVRPLSMITSSPSLGPTTTLRISTVLSSLTTYTNVPCGLRWTAAEGTMLTSFFVSTRARAFTNWLGNRVLSSLGKTALHLMVPVFGSIWLSTV